MGKGDSPRPVNKKKYDEGYNRIFRDKKCLCRVIYQHIRNDCALEIELKVRSKEKETYLLEYTALSQDEGYVSYKDKDEGYVSYKDRAPNLKTLKNNLKELTTCLFNITGIDCDKFNVLSLEFADTDLEKAYNDGMLSRLNSKL